MIKTEDIVFLTDLYEFTMAYTFFKEDRHEEIVYLRYVRRRIPDQVNI